MKNFRSSCYDLSSVEYVEKCLQRVKHRRLLSNKGRFLVRFSNVDVSKHNLANDSVELSHVLLPSPFFNKNQRAKFITQILNGLLMACRLHRFEELTEFMRSFHRVITVYDGLNLYYLS